MKIGAHGYIWCSEWNNSKLYLIDKAKALGLDFLEIPFMSIDNIDSAAIRKRLADNDIEALTTTALGPCYDLTSDDPAIRSKGVEYLKKCIKKNAEIGSKLFCGVIYSEVGKRIPGKPSNREWERAVKGLGDAAAYAEEFGVTLCIEPVNRYETFLVNTSEQALTLMKMIDKDNVKILLDTYHMNIEEKSIYAAIKKVGSNIRHLHICENDRGIPGSGHVEWDEFFKALKEINYDGYCSFESFIDVTEDLKAATCIWREIAPDGDTFVKEGLRFIKEKMNLK